MIPLAHGHFSPSFTFHLEDPHQSGLLSLLNERFGLHIDILKRVLRMRVVPQGETPHAEGEQLIELGLTTPPGQGAYRLTCQTVSPDRCKLILEQGAAVLLAFEHAFALDADTRLETRNLLVSHLQWDGHGPTGVFSAPDRNKALVLVSAPKDQARAVSGILEEHVPAGTTVRILVEHAGEADPHADLHADLHGRSFLRADLRHGLEGWEGPAISSIVLVCVTGEDALDPEEIFEAIDWRAAQSIRLFYGGFVQKLPAERFSGIMEGEVPLLTATGADLPPLLFAQRAWGTGVSEVLQKAFEEEIPDDLRVARQSEATVISPPQYRVNSAYWPLHRFWTLPNVQPPEEEAAFSFRWAMKAVFGHGQTEAGETNMQSAVHHLREVTARCQEDGIRVLACRLGGERPVYLLMDLHLLTLATDASYARGLNPLEASFKAIDETACRVLSHDAGDMQVVLLHVEEDSAAPALHAVLAQVAQTLRSDASLQTPTARMSDYLQASADVITLSTAINAIANDQNFALPDATLRAFFDRHPRLTVLVTSHVLSHAAPSKIRTFMQTLDRAELKILPKESKALLKLLIDTRVFPAANERFWQNLEDQPYDARRWAALQVLEQLPTQDYHVRAPDALKKLDLKDEDLAFNRVLGSLKQGDLDAALSHGRNAVLARKLSPDNERDILALAILARDADAVALIEGALAEPLSPLDQAYRDAGIAARQGALSEATRMSTTQKILSLDEDFVDLRVTGRSYETLAEFAREPQPGRDVICVITAKNEETRLRETMAYHRSIGIEHFILIDNMSSDGTLDLARDYGAKIIQTPESYKESRYGMAWVNDVLDLHCTGFWTLVVDADEMFVYPGAEARPLPAFVAGLEAKSYDAFSCVLLDMYPEAPISHFDDVPKGELRALYKYFDAHNFAFWPRLRSPLLGLSGGVRDRFFRTGRFAHLAPIAQTKTPLVRWTRGMKYLTSTHDITPVNSPVFFGALEHYKYTPDFVQRAKREVVRKEHWGGGSEYAAYASVLEADPDASFIDPVFSHARETSTQLIRTVCPFPWDESLM